NVLVLTMHSDDVSVRQSLKAGARGYLLKDSDDVDLLNAVKAVGRGKSFFSPVVSKVLLTAYRGDGAGQAIADNLALPTDREHGNRRVSGHFLRDAADQHVRDARPAGRRDGDRVGAARGLDDALVGIAELDPGLDAQPALHGAGDERLERLPRARDDVRLRDA